ncbi:hypothetical protein BGZ89_009573 [Linnemannia elongata]|nr:hypothetical protein BGZ89_009573 [Linnemannia elongata]
MDFSRFNDTVNAFEDPICQHQQQQQQQQQQQEHQLLQQRRYEVIQYQQNTAARLQRQLQTHAHRPPFLLNRHSKRHSARPERHKCTSKHCKHSTHGNHRIHKEKSPCAKGHRNSIKEAQRRSFLKSTFHKNGRMYMLAHQDWYTQYRRQRGPGGVMRKLTLENARRRKAMITLLPSSYFGINNRLSSGSGGGNNNKPSLSDGYDSVGDGSGSNAKDIGAEGDTGGEGKEADDDDDDIDLAGAKEDFPDRATETIQAVKRPTFMGIAEPVSYQHRGLIPKARSLGSRLSPWLLQLVISTAFTPLLLTYM